MAKAKPIRVGILGLGRAGWGMHRRELTGKGKKSKYTIVAGCDVQPERLQQLTAEFPKAAGYTDYTDLLADDNVEMVIVATRSVDHCKHVIDALKSGKHVLAEKPVGLNVREVDRQLAAARKAEGKLVFRQNRRFDPDFLHVREVIASGVLGDIFLVKLARHGYQRRQDWQTIVEFGGGQLNNWGPHIIDHGLQLMGYGVKQMWADVKLIAAAGDANDHFKVVMKNDAGIVVDIEISGGVALPAAVWHVVGTRGALVSDGRESHLKYLDPKQKLADIEAIAETPPQSGPFGNPEKLKWIEKTVKAVPRRKSPDFYDAVYETIRLDKPFPVSWEEAREVVKVTEKIGKMATLDVKT